MFAERLKEQRHKQHISQMALSKLIGVSQQAIGSWEVGRTSPDKEMITTLAHFFGVSTDYLLGNDHITTTNNITVTNNNGAISGSGTAIYNNVTNNNVDNVLSALFGKSPDAMQTLKKIKITSSGELADVDVADKRYIATLAKAMIKALEDAQNKGSDTAFVQLDK